MTHPCTPHDRNDSRLAWHSSLLVLAFYASTAAAQLPRMDGIGQPLPPGAINRMGTGQLIHPGRVSELRFSPDGKHLVSLSDRGMRIWDVATGALLGRNHAIVQEVLFHPNRSTMIFVGSRPTCWSWDLQQNQPRTLWDQESRHVNAAALTPDGKQLMFSCEDGFHVLELGKSQEPELLWKTTEAFTKPMQFSPDGRYLAIGSADRIHLWDCKRGQKLRSYNFPSPSSCVFRPDSKGLAAAGKFGLRIFQTDFEEEWPEFSPVADAVHVELASDGKSLLGFRLLDGKGLALARWDIVTGKELFSLVLQENQIVAALDATAKHFAIADGTLRLFHFKTGKNRFLVEPFAQMTNPAFVDRAGKALACITGDTTVTFWEVDTARILRDVRNPLAAEKGITLSPRGKYIAAWLEAEHRGSLMLMDAATGLTRWQTNPKEMLLPSDLQLITFSSDERFLVEVRDEEVLLRDVETGKQRRVLFRGKVNDLPTLSLDGRLLFFSDGRVIETATQQVRHTFPDGASQTLPSPDGKTIAQIKFSFLQIDLIQIGTFQTLQRLSTGTELEILAFSPDRHWLVAGDKEGTIHVWDRQGVYRHHFQGHQESITGFAFSDDGRRLVSTSEDRTAVVWDLKTIPDRPRLSAPPDDATLQTCWNWLAARSGTQSGKAMTLYQSRPHETLKFFQARVKPALPVADSDLQRGFKELAHPNYNLRQQAMRELAAMDEQAEHALRKLLDKEMPAETRNRIEQLLFRIEHVQDNSERLREVRAVEVLERIATEEAVTLLRSWADGAPRARLTREAKLALQRLQMLP